MIDPRMKRSAHHPSESACALSGPERLERLQESLAYRFHDPSILDEALTHRSLLNEVNEPGRRDNERLEFLGDAVLGLIVADMLMRAFPEGHEGELTLHRSALVKRKRLGEIAAKLHLGNYLYLGKGEEQTAGRQKTSILADAFEAIVGAIYLDGGFEAAQRVVQGQFAVPLDEVIRHRQVRVDAKTSVQELLLAFFRAPPVYEVTEEQGPEHAKTFVVRLLMHQHGLALGTGRNKKEAEQDAAEQFLKHLASNPLGMR